MGLTEIDGGCGWGGSDTRGCDFPPLLDWDDVLRDEREDPLGFARRATLALLTQSGAGLLAGFGGGNQIGLEEVRRTVALFPRPLAAAGVVRGSGGEAIGARC